ncbi:MAG: tetratricopeptide repeat protein [Kofleriaceae bacterium]
MDHRLASIVVLGLAAAPLTAAADARSDARARIDHATTLHAEGKFAEALQELSIAYTLDPRPELLYGIAQLHFQLGDCDQATTFYERFLSTRPGETAAAAAREAITGCKLRSAEPARGTLEGDAPPIGQPLPPGPSPAAAERPRWYMDKAGLSLIGGGVVLGIAGLWTYDSALGDLDEAEAAKSYGEHADLVDSAHGKRVYAVIFGGVAVAATGVGVYRLIRRRAESRALAIVPTGDGGMVTWLGRF